MHRSTVERKLRDAHQRLVRVRGELVVLDEQLAVVNDIADDTRIKALVSETPVACREYDDASRQAAAGLRTRNALLETIAELEQKRDALLERLVIESD